MSSTLGSITELELPMFHKTLKAKVDTGATTCCLHGTNITVKNKTVSFINSDLSQNTITMPLSSVSDVHSADHGVDQRPVVQLNVMISGTLLENIEFNINDRSKMDVKILLGQNLLKSGGFVVDVGVTESDVPVDTAEPSVVDPVSTYDQHTSIPLTLQFDVARQVFVAEFSIECLKNLVATHE